MKYNKTVGMVSIQIDTKRIDDNVRRAQDLLDQQVLNDMIPYMPYQEGAMVGATHIIEPGLISTNTPYAHYQYEGEIYGPNIPIRDDEGNITGWWSPPNKTKTGRLLTYNKTFNPKATDHWFEHAKEEHGEQWLDLVRREVVKG